MTETMTERETRDFLAHGKRTAKVAWTAASGQPHLAPVWFVVDDDANTVEVVFNTSADSAKGRAMQRDPRISMLVDDDQPPFSYVKMTGSVRISEDLSELRRWATRIGGRYMGADRADEFGTRNGVPGELLVRLRPTRTIGLRGVTD